MRFHTDPHTSRVKRSETMIRALVLANFLVLILVSCTKGDKVPAYVQVDNIQVSTDPVTQGSGSHRITDVWAFDNDRANVLPAMETGSIDCTMRTIGESMSRPHTPDSNVTVIATIDISIGATINAAMAGQTPPRPLTHDLFLNALESFGAKVSRAVIIAVEEEVYFARLILEAENEIMDRKIVELDARPSDCIALAVRSDCPIYVLKALWESLQDMSSVLEEMRSKGMDLGGE